MHQRDRVNEGVIIRYYEGVKGKHEAEIVLCCEYDMKEWERRNV
jgi:hypothetical protein